MQEKIENSYLMNLTDADEEYIKIFERKIENKNIWPEDERS